MLENGFCLLPRVTPKIAHEEEIVNRVLEINLLCEELENSKILVSQFYLLYPF